MRGFREVGWVAAVASTALGCYMVSLKVASERAALETVENRIVLAQRDIRVLQTEIGTRGRLDQLESWNVKVLALSAPQAHQFMEGEFQLATLAAPKKTVDPSAPVVLASAPAPARRPVVSDDGGEDAAERQGGPTARELMHIASLKRDVPAPAAEKTVDKPKVTDAKTVKPVKAAAIAPAKSTAKADTVPAKAPAKTVAAKPESKTKAPVAVTKTKDIKARQ